MAAAVPARALEDRRTRPLSVMEFGAKGNGEEDDAPAIQASLRATGRVFFPNGTYRIAVPLVIPSGAVLSGESRSGVVMRRFTAGPVIASLGTGAALYDLTIDGNAALPASGALISVPSLQGRQTFVRVDVRNCPGVCLEFASNGGAGFSSFGSTYRSLAPAGKGASVKVSGTDTEAIPRKFYATESDGSTLFDFGGANNFYASGFYTNGLIFGPTSTKVFLNDMRIGAAGGTVTVRGADHVLSGVSASPIVLECTGSAVDVQAPDWDVTDLGRRNNVTLLSRSYDVAWTAGGTSPALGDGSLYTRWSRNGDRATVQLDLTIGRTTTLGTGFWEFSLPAPDQPAAPVQICGMATATNSNMTAIDLGSVRVEPGRQRLRILSSKGFLAATLPFTWKPGDNLRLECSYTVR
jgi:hypothetical protein